MKFSTNKMPMLVVVFVLSILPFCIAQESGAKGQVNAEQVKGLVEAVEDLVSSFGSQYADGHKYLDCAKNMADEAGNGKVSIDKFRQLQHDALTANPLLAGQPILFTVHALDKYGTHIYMRPHAYIKQGGALKLLDPATGHVRTLLSAPDGIIRRPCVSYDGRRIVFAMSKNLSDNFHIYEIEVDRDAMFDGGELAVKQLTFAPDVSDVDPIYLLDGDIAFCSTRDIKYVPCDTQIVSQLFRMDGDGANIHQITRSTSHENELSMMSDGRILYSRWDYVDRNFGDGHGFWVTNPDGTNQAIIWGNNTAHPSAGWSARVIPGTGKLVCVLGTHHHTLGGALAVLDLRQAIEGRESVLRTWPENVSKLFENLPTYDPQKEKGRSDVKMATLTWPDESRKLLAKEPYMRLYGWTDALKDVRPWYNSPYPLSEKYFLCVRADIKTDPPGIYLVDTFGNEVLVHKEQSGIYSPMPFAPHPKPVSMPPRRDYGEGDGTFYIQNVYEGTDMPGIEPGSVKSVRVVEAISKRGLSSGWWLGLGRQSPSLNWTDFNAKRILGTAPVEEDGSASFYVPSDRYLYFQLLDKDGMMIQSMRSGTSIHSGEKMGCVGCHESRRSSGNSSLSGQFTLAAKRSPSKLAPWYGASRAFSYAVEVQPVFDKHCVKCHDFGKEGSKKLILAGDKTPSFNMSYMELWGKGYTGSIGAGPAAHMPAKSWGSHTSKLIKTLRKGHHDVKLDKESLDRLITWVDINGPYYPTSYAAFDGNWPGRIPLDRKQTERLLKLTGMKFPEIGEARLFNSPMITFDRPELSPCLDRLEKDSDQYKEALAIIRSGKEILKSKPRADMPGFVAFDTDLRRQIHLEKYQKIERDVRKAIREGTKVYDSSVAENETMGL